MFHRADSENANTSIEQSRLHYSYIDIARIIASVMVIATHVVMHYINCFSCHSLSWTAMLSAKAITMFAVPLFFMISGAMILSSKKDESYKSFLKRRFSRIAIPFLTWSFVYYLFNVFIKDKYDFGIFVFFKALFTQDISGHLWFIYSLLVLYFFFPFFRTILQRASKKQVIVFICVLFAFGSFLPCINTVLKMTMGFKIAVPVLSKIAVYLGYALLGYVIHNTAQTKLLRRVSYLLGLIALFLLIIITFVVSGKKINQTFLELTYPLVVLYSIAVFLFMKNAWGSIVFSSTARARLASLALMSYTAYLAHMLFLRTMQLWLTKTVLNSMTSVEAFLFLFVEFVLCVLGSYLVAYIFSKIKYINRLF